MGEHTILLRPYESLTQAWIPDAILTYNIR